MREYKLIKFNLYSIVNMPNDCYNTLTISGPIDILISFYEKAKSEDSYLNFNHFHPCPEYETWYQWNIDNWGTKWDAYEVEDPIMPINEGDKLVYIFQTAWTPPTKWLIYISVLYPDLFFSIESEESGNDFYVQSMIKNGKIVYEEKLSYCEYKYRQQRCQRITKILIKEILSYPNLANIILTEEDDLNEIFIHHSKELYVKYTKDIDDSAMIHMKQLIIKRYEKAINVFRKWKQITKKYDSSSDSSSEE